MTAPDRRTPLMCEDAGRAAEEARLTDADYQAQAEFRYALRRFVRLSENHARAAGATPQQHQLLLAIRGHPSYPQVSITDIAERLQLRHHSTSLLVDRAVRRGLLRRAADPADLRRVFVSLTDEGNGILARVTLANRAAMRPLEDTLLRMRALMGRMPAEARAGANGDGQEPATAAETRRRSGTHAG
ncbi:MAG TPA: MarR family transcriptional regulator [Chloroflexota bacterium]|nr:MarR family transcriptional regulator [Chloroflexota bacterium]